ncbi:hypothetical protein [Microbacterium aurantiacum]|uniref:hypothetical protein n=1 Tax=Microbacterium aurantiacum TaxID=162393 RepID=UPI0034265216
MDVAVAVVQAYLRVNGYLTVAEYPVLDAATRPARTVTDLDILAVRLHRTSGTTGPADAPLDPALGAVTGAADMIVGEVKEGRPHPNPAMRDPAVLEAALTRFGCCRPADAPWLVAELLRTGRAIAPEGHTIRTVVFGNPTSAPHPGAPWHIVPFTQVLGFLEEHLSAHWQVIGRTQIKDDTLGLLALREKSRRAGAHPAAAAILDSERGSR